ncbi:MAG: hypothetical protein ABI703_11960 [Gemmatimonadales bacterium]
MADRGPRCVRRLAVPLVVMALGTVAGCAPGNRDTLSAPPRFQAAIKTSGFVWGVQGHPGKQAAYADSGEGLARQLDYLDSLGATHYRVDVGPDSAGRVHPGFGGIVAAAAVRGIEILPVLVTQPDWAAPDSVNYRRGYTIGFNFGSRYQGRFTHVEAGNELDNQVLKFTVDSTAHPARRNYQEGSSLDQYVDTLLSKTTWFLRGMTEGIHLGSPGTKVIIDAGWRHYAYFEALHRGGVPFDVYGYHWYSEMGSFAAEVLPHLPDPGKEVWVTEANRRNTEDSLNDPAGQAEWIAWFARELLAIPRVRALFIYELYDELAFGPRDEAYYGIVKCSDPGCTGPREPKPGFHAYRAAIENETSAPSPPAELSATSDTRPDRPSAVP